MPLKGPQLCFWKILREGVSRWYQLLSCPKVKQLTLCKVDFDVSKGSSIFILVVPLRENSNFVRVRYEVPRQGPTGLYVACLHRPVFDFEVGPRLATNLRCDAHSVADAFCSGSDVACFLLRAPEYIPLGKPNSTPGVWVNQCPSQMNKT